MKYEWLGEEKNLVALSLETHFGTSMADGVWTLLDNELVWRGNSPKLTSVIIACGRVLESAMV